MIRVLFQLIWRLFWGSAPKQGKPAPEEGQLLNVGSSRAAGWTYGDVVTSVYLNRNYKGQPYFKVGFRRLVKDGRHVSNSFFVDDLKDVEFGIARARAWLHDSKIT
jgi:hypothetical protein